MRLHHRLAAHLILRRRRDEVDDEVEGVPVDCEVVLVEDDIACVRSP